MRIQNLKDVFMVIDKLYLYLEEKKYDFDDNGFPVFKQEVFLDEWPDLVVPYSKRNNWRVTNPQRTLLCFYDKDQNLYPRLCKALDEIDEYKKFMGVVGLDVTITDDMDEEWQKAICLLNQLFLAILAVNDIKIVINTRTAGLNENDVFRNVPEDVMAASGFLGCDVIKDECNFLYLKKILFVMPRRLIIYGKHDRIAEKQLEAMGIDYRVYMDFHRLCKEVRHGGQ